MVLDLARRLGLLTAGRPEWARVTLPLGAVVLDLALWGGRTEARTVWSPPFVVVLASAALCGIVLVRRDQRPLVAYGAAWAHGVVWAAVLPYYEPTALLLLALFAVARRVDGRACSVVLASLALPLGLNTLNAATLGGFGPGATLGTAAVWIVLAAVPWSWGRAGRRRERLVELEAARAESDRAAAVRDERLRLAREVHDLVSHGVSGVLFQSAGLRRAHRLEGDVDQVVADIEQASLETLRALRDLLTLLGSEAAPGLEGATASLDHLDGLVSRARTWGLDIDVTTSGDPRPLPADSEVVAFHVVREGLTNALRHAGPGAHVEVAVHHRPESVRIAVRSRALLGASPVSVPASGHGLRGLRERVGGVTGTLTARPVDDAYLLEVVLPRAVEGYPSAGPLVPRSETRPQR